MHIIAERLKELREARHLSQRAFAQQLGVPQPSYSRYETSDDERFVYPGSNIVIRICKLFDCRAGWLLGLEGAESAPLPTIQTGDINGNVIVGNGNTIAPPKSTSTSRSTPRKSKPRK
jgi:transcriptional regulator with XRE-family HTH domain